MTRHRAAALAAVLVALLWPALQAQQGETPPSTPAKKAPAAQATRKPGGITWVASYDLALGRMGANQAPVILYFTYDG